MEFLILLRLLYNNEPIRFDIPFFHSQPQWVTSSLNELNLYLTNISNNIAISDETTILNVTSTSSSIILTVNNRDKLSNYLHVFCNNYEQGNYLSYESYDYLKHSFFRSISTKPQNNYPVTDISYLPFIIAEYMKDNNFIRNIDIHLEDREGLVEYPIHIYEQDENGEFIGFNTNKDDYFKWELTVDITPYTKSSIKKVKQINRKSPLKKYSKQQQKIFNILETYTKANSIYRIEKENLMQLVKVKNIDEAISRLNKQYKEINDTEQKLIWHDRETGYYIIHDVWQ